MLKKIISILVIFGLFLPIFSFAQEQGILPPKDINEAKGIGEKALKVFQEDLPGILKETLTEKVFPVWKKMWDWFDANIWLKVLPKGKSELEKRRAIIKEEFKKEKKELKTELPEVEKSLWERFKELIK